MNKRFIIVILTLSVFANCHKTTTASATTGGTMFWTDSQNSIASCGTLTVTVDGTTTTTISSALNSEPTNCVNTTGVVGEGGYLLLEQGSHKYTVTSASGCISTSGAFTITANSCNKVKILAPASIIGTWKKITDEVIEADSASNPATIVSDQFTVYEATLVFKTGNQFEQHITSPTVLDDYGTYTLGTVQGRNTLRLQSPVNDVTSFYTLTDTQLVLMNYDDLNGPTWRTDIVTFQRQ